MMLDCLCGTPRGGCLICRRAKVNRPLPRADSHGGVLREDQNPNRGATFCAALPTNTGERV